jgi:nucleotide-binding universal stress UspA family protein
MMENMKKILVVCRVPEACQTVVDYGATLSKTFNAELIILHIIYDPFIRGDWNLPIPLGTVEEEYNKIRENAKKTLDALVTSVRTKGISVRELVREGKPTYETLKAAMEEKADLIIMLSHEESRLEHLLFGRSNDDLIRRMPSSTLLVKSEPGPIPG